MIYYQSKMQIILQAINYAGTSIFSIIMKLYLLVVKDELLIDIDYSLIRGISSCNWRWVTHKEQFTVDLRYQYPLHFKKDVFHYVVHVCMYGVKLALNVWNVKLPSPENLHQWIYRSSILMGPAFLSHLTTVYDKRIFL